MYEPEDVEQTESDGYSADDDNDIIAGMDSTTAGAGGDTAEEADDEAAAALGDDAANDENALSQLMRHSHESVLRSEPAEPTTFAELLECEKAKGMGWAEASVLEKRRLFDANGHRRDIEAMMSGTDPHSEMRMEPLDAAVFADLTQQQSAARDSEVVASECEMLWTPEAEAAEKGLEDLMRSMRLNLSGWNNDEQQPQQDEAEPSTPPPAQPTPTQESKSPDSDVQDESAEEQESLVAQWSVEQMAHQLSRLAVTRIINEPTALRTRRRCTTTSGAWSRARYLAGVHALQTLLKYF